MLSSDTNTASYDVECVENDGGREDDNGSDVKQSTDSNNELSKNNDNSSIYTIFSETDDKEESVNIAQGKHSNLEKGKLLNDNSNGTIGNNST